MIVLHLRLKNLDSSYLLKTPPLPSVKIESAKQEPPQPVDNSGQSSAYHICLWKNNCANIGSSAENCVATSTKMCQLVHDASVSPLLACSSERSLDMADGILCRFRIRDVASFAF